MKLGLQVSLSHCRIFFYLPGDKSSADCTSHFVFLVDFRMLTPDL